MNPATLEKHGQAFSKHFTVESSRPVRDQRVLLFIRTTVATTYNLLLLLPTFHTYAASLVATTARKISRPRKVDAARGNFCSFESIDRLTSSTSKCLICRKNVNSFEKCVEDEEWDGQGWECYRDRTYSTRSTIMLGTRATPARWWNIQRINLGGRLDRHVALTSRW